MNRLTQSELIGIVMSVMLIVGGGTLLDRALSAEMIRQVLRSTGFAKQFRARRQSTAWRAGVLGRRLRTENQSRGLHASMLWP